MNPTMKIKKVSFSYEAHALDKMFFFFAFYIYLSDKIMWRFQLIHFCSQLIAMIKRLGMLIFTDNAYFIYYGSSRMANSVL